MPKPRVVLDVPKKDVEIQDLEEKIIELQKAAADKENQHQTECSSWTCLEKLPVGSICLFCFFDDGCGKFLGK